MWNRTLAIVATLLIVTAIVAQFYWLSCCGRALMVRSEAATSGEEHGAAAHAEAERILHDGGFAPVLGFWVAIVAIFPATAARCDAREC